MHIALIGMSGTGKSHWSRKMVDIGYQRIGCDDRIAARLAQEVGAPTGEFFHMAQWMGLPYEAHYPQRAERYQAHEIAVMQEIATSLAGAQADADVVVDTTGSVIYVPEATLHDLRRVARLVYLAPPVDAFQTMLQSYLKNPRPVLWNGVYQQEVDESPLDAFERCYPQLLTARDCLYRRYSHVTIPWEIHGGADVGVETLIERILASA